MSKSLFKSTSIVSSMTMVSRVLGFVRDMIMAQIFGASASVDAFLIAFKIPNFMRGLFAEGSFSQAFVPVLSEYRHQRDQSEVRQFISRIAGSLGSVLFIITIIGVLASPLLVHLFAPGLDPLRFSYANDMLRITFPYMMLISLTALVAAILNCYGSFAIPAFTPAWLNICLIATAIWLAPHFKIPVEAQAWGVFIAGLVQLFFQIPKLSKIGMLTLPRWNWHDAGVKRVLKLMIPAIFGASVGQISLLLNTIFASFLPIGSVTWLYYADRLAYFPLGVFGVALATVVLPHLSRQHAANDPQQFMRAMDWGIRCNLIIGLPAVVILLVIGGPIIATLFQYGRFHVHDVLMTRDTVFAYALGLQAFMLVKLLSTGFYAQQNIKTPVKIAIVSLAVNILLNAILIVPLRHVGLALATSLSSWLNVVLLYVGLYSRNIFYPQIGFRIFLLRLIAANLALAIILWIGSASLNVWFDWSWGERCLHLLTILVLAGGTYTLTLWLAGLRIHHFIVSDASG